MYHAIVIPMFFTDLFHMGVLFRLFIFKHANLYFYVILSNRAEAARLFSATSGLEYSFFSHSNTSVQQDQHSWLRVATKNKAQLSGLNVQSAHICFCVTVTPTTIPGSMDSVSF